MKIMLSRLDFTEKSISLRHLGVNHQPINLLYLAATLEQAGHNIVFADELAGDLFEKRFNEEKPDLVGFNSTSPIMNRVIEAADYAKKGGAKVVLGGTHATLAPELCIEHPSFDAVFAGESERTFVQYLDGQDPATIPGLYIKGDGEILTGPPCTPIEDLDSLPFPARHLLDWKRYTKDNELGFLLRDKFDRARVLGSRGCPQHCTFCSRYVVHGRKVRYRSLENIFAELEQLQKDMGIYNYIFIDDYFTFNQQRVVQFCEELLKRCWSNVQWIANARVDLEHETMSLMKRAGCKLISFGVESGSQRILDEVKKDIRVEDVIRAFDDAKRAQINTRAYLIIDLPGETDEDFQKTLDLAIRINPTIISLNIFMPIAGSDIYTKKYNGEYIDVGRHHFYHTYDKSVTAKQRKFLLRYYLRPAYFLNFIRNLSFNTVLYYLKMFRIFLRLRSQNDPAF